MGLIKAAASAIGSTMHDQWKEAIRCENMTNDILMVKKTTPNGVISNKSTIIVAPGQCAIIFDNGRVIDATAEEGYYILLIVLLHLHSLQDNLEQYLKKCGNVLHIMEQVLNNKQYFSSTQRK